MNSDFVLGAYMVLTAEQFSEWRKTKKLKRFMETHIVVQSALHAMRYFAQWFNSVLVVDLTMNKVIAYVSQNAPLEIDTSPPPFHERWLQRIDRPEGIVTKITEVDYDYPHPSGNYVRAGSMLSKSPRKDANVSDG